jgi:hypothetical protein
MSFFSTKKKTQINNETEEPIIINSENKISEGTPSSIISEMKSESSNTKDQILQTSPSVMVDETDKLASVEYDYPAYEYSSSFLESISFDLYSESTENEIKKSFDKTYSFFKKSWYGIKEAYTYVSNISEEYIINEMKQQEPNEHHSKNRYIESGLDVSL